MFDRRAHAEEIIADLIGKMWNWFFIGAAGAAIVIAACIAFFVGVNVPNLIYWIGTAIAFGCFAQASNLSNEIRSRRAHL